MNLDVQEVNAHAHRLMRGGSTAIALDHKGRIVCVAARGANAPPLGTPLDPFRGLSGACVRIGQTQVCDEVESDTRVDLPVCRSLGVRSMVFVPLRTTNEVLGVLAAFSDQPRHFREPQVFLLELLARVVAESCAGMHPEPWLKPAPRPQLEMAEVRLFETAQQDDGGGRSRGLLYAGLALAMVASGLLFYLGRTRSTHTEPAQHPSSAVRTPAQNTAALRTAPPVPDVEFSSAAGYSRVTVWLAGAAAHDCRALNNPNRIYCDLNGISLPRELLRKPLGRDKRVRGVRLGQHRPGIARVVVDLPAIPPAHTITRLRNPDRLLLEFFDVPRRADSSPAPSAKQKR